MSELIAALNQLEKEKGIDKDVIMEAIENMTVLELSELVKEMEEKNLYQGRLCNYLNGSAVQKFLVKE